ncbi:MAG TPA: hypothetical protein VMZ25_10905, partial [Terriglobales bacterium]|nr:hypothetical protein [Terriglobales bacterium]
MKMHAFWKSFIPVLVLLAGHLQAQITQRTRLAYGDTPPPSIPSPASSSTEYSSSNDTKIETSPLLRTPDVKKMKIGFDWQAAANQSFFGLAIQHGIRMSQRKTRTELDGPFFEDYRNAVSGLDGWGDTDSVFTNYVAHPFQGAVTGFIQIQNDPHGIRQEFGRHGVYWRSRTKAMAWAALYSTQFELGPVSEASIGNVGRKRGTMGFVDLVMTPVGGMGLIVAEDALDKKWIQGLESHTPGLNRRRVYRMVFNPQRTLANLLRFKKPWHRDTRSIDWQPDPSTPTPAGVS